MPRSNDLGRAFEYICIQCLQEEISRLRPVFVVKNSNYYQDEQEWKRLDSSTQRIMEKEARAAIPTLRELEPMIEENNGDILELRLQSDKEGIVGDVRDILLVRDSEKWIIGISVKHNHFAVKHSRLSNVLDFGKQWLDTPCSNAYWAAIEPIFKPLTELRGKVKWRDLPQKEEKVYIPLLYLELPKQP